MSENEKKLLADYPDLMLDWDMEKNAGIRPEQVSVGSHQMICWKCHKCGRSWSSEARSRVRGNGCKCDAMMRKTASLRKRLVERDGSLAEKRPDLAAQWHPTKNDGITPDEITCHSTYKAWWLDETGREWQTQVAVRCRSAVNTGAPRHIPCVGQNDFATEHPELAAQWNDERNGTFTPDQITSGSNRRVWWRCQKGHEWKAAVSSRTAGRGCPFCNQERSTSFPEQAIFFYLKKVFPSTCSRYRLEEHLEIDIYLPEHQIGIEYDGAYYHQSAKKGKIDAQKNKRLKELGIRLIRVVEDGIAPPSDTDDIIWSHSNQLETTITAVLNLVCGIIGTDHNVTVCIDSDKTEIWEQYILQEKANSILEKRPELKKEWHPTKNGSLKPEYIPYGSNKRLWWKCTKCAYEWQCPAASRVRGTNCPVCTGTIVVKGLNDLTTTHPQLMKEWDFAKNEGISPEKYSAGSGKYVWWKCSECGYEWNAMISNRTRSRKCPQCAGRVTALEKSLGRAFPLLVEQWCSARNKNLSPYNVLPHSDRKVWWECAMGHIWEAAISSRVRGNGCPYCGNKILLPGFNDFATEHPELAKEWDDSKNSIQPTEVFSGSSRKVYWVCREGHSWQAAIANRVRGNGCPYCMKKRTIKGENDLETMAPVLAREWHPTKNGELLPQNVTTGSNRKVWWQCKTCGYEWQAIIWSRHKGRGCPRCAGKLKFD